MKLSRDLQVEARKPRAIERGENVKYVMSEKMQEKSKEKRTISCFQINVRVIA
jgi:hypothetical protein